MNTIASFPTTGRLYNSRRQFFVTDMINELKQYKSVKIFEQEVKGWFALQLTSEEPLNRENNNDNILYTYNYLLRRGKDGRYLIVSNHFDLVTSLLDIHHFSKKLSNPDINIIMLVNDLEKKPSVYTMSAVFARIEGYGQALRSIAFYGSDLAEASLFQRLLPDVIPSRVTLRDVTTRTDVLSLGSHGEISFQYNGSKSLYDVDLALRFLSERDYLKWEIYEYE